LTVTLSRLSTSTKSRVVLLVLARKMPTRSVFISVRLGVYIGVLVAYVEGRIQFDNTRLKEINFFDHVLYKNPAMKYTQIKR